MCKVSKGKAVFREAYKTTILTPGECSELLAGYPSTFLLFFIRQKLNKTMRQARANVLQMPTVPDKSLSLSIGVEMGDGKPAHKGCKGWKRAMFRKSQEK